MYLMYKTICFDRNRDAVQGAENGAVRGAEDFKVKHLKEPT